MYKQSRIITNLVRSWLLLTFAQYGMHSLLKSIYIPMSEWCMLGCTKLPSFSAKKIIKDKQQQQYVSNNAMYAGKMKMNQYDKSEEEEERSA